MAGRTTETRYRPITLRGSCHSTMAQQEQDREDLLREATALTMRAELAVDRLEEHVIVGFRSNGAPSVFFGADPVYQFTTENEIRRGFRDGNLIKAVDGKLFSLRRERRQGQLHLLRSELDGEQTREYLQESRKRLEALHTSLVSGSFELVGSVPQTEEVTSRIVEWLNSLPNELSVAGKPNVA